MFFEQIPALARCPRALRHLLHPLLSTRVRDGAAFSLKRVCTGRAGVDLLWLAGRCTRVLQRIRNVPNPQLLEGGRRELADDVAWSVPAGGPPAMREPAIQAGWCGPVSVALLPTPFRLEFF